MYGAGGRDTLALGDDMAVVGRKTTADRSGSTHIQRLHEHWNYLAAVVGAEVCTTCPYMVRRFGRRGHDGRLSHLLFHFACWILGKAQLPADQTVGAQRHRWISCEWFHTSPQDHPGAVIIAIMTTNI